MEQVTKMLEYIRANPAWSVGVAIAAAVFYYLLNRKSRLVREAEKRIEALRQERPDPYRNFRPPH